MPHLITKFIPLPFAILTSSLVFAGPPVAYDEWSVDNGTIDTTISCSNVGTSCQTLASDNGFQYEEVTTPVYSFLRLILTDKDASGNPVNLAFTSETYTPFALISGGIAQGVATKQTISDTSNNFLLTAEVQKGNMRGLNASTAEDMYTAKLDQSFTDAEISSGFAFTNYTEFATAPATSPDTNIERGRILDISQDVLTGEAGDTTKKQIFIHRQRKGNAGNSDSPFGFAPGGLPAEFMVGGEYFVTSPITSAGSMSLPDTQNGIAGTTSTTINWNAGNDISTTWIAQNSNIRDSAVDLSYQRVANNSTSTETSAVVIDLPAPANPFDWDANFGTQPILP